MPYTSLTALFIILAYLLLGAPVRLKSESFLEADTVNINASVDGQLTFQQVNFNMDFRVAPIVVLTPNEDNADPAHIRIRNVTTSGFEVAVVEPAGENGESGAMNNIAYFAMEPGRLVTDGGERIESAFHETNVTISGVGGDTWSNVCFINCFCAQPSVVGMPQTMVNETGAPPGNASVPFLTLSTQNVGTGGFCVTNMLSETGAGNLVNNERLGYIAFQSGTGNFNDNCGTNILFDSFNTGNTIDGHDNAGTNVNWNAAFTCNPLLNATQEAFNGNNGGWVRYTNNCACNVTLLIDEDRTNDAERAHITECVSVLAFSQALQESLTRETVIEWAGGGGNNNWGQNANWNGWNGNCATLVQGDALLYDNTGSARTCSLINTNYNTPLGEIRFEECTAYTLSNNPGACTTMDEGGLILNNSNVTQTIQAQLNATGSSIGVAATNADFNFTASSSIDLSDTSGVTLYVTGNNDTTMSGTLVGACGALFKDNNGTLTLNGNSANTYTGLTTVNDGTLALNKSVANGAIAGDIQVNAGATLRLDSANQIADTSNITLNGGTFQTGVNESINTLTLSANSVIDLSGGNAILTMLGDINLNGFTLSIHNYDGSYSGGGNDRIISNGSVNAGGGNIIFYGDNGVSAWGSTYRHGAAFDPNEVVPAPEPSTWVGIIGLSGAVIWHWKKKRKRPGPQPCA